MGDRPVLASQPRRSGHCLQSKAEPAWSRVTSTSALQSHTPDSTIGRLGRRHPTQTSGGVGDDCAAQHKCGGWLPLGAV
eukprot:scaffold165014_cov36-Prasinocladus_malaysianus.AAC.1